MTPPVKPFDPASLIRPHIRLIEPYQPILPFEVLSQQYGRALEDIVKLDANENPYGPLPAVAEALAHMPFSHIYPDPESRLLRGALAEHTGVPQDLLLAGAGADELLDLVLRLLIEPGDAVLTFPPTFGMYAFDGQVNAARMVSVPRTADFALDLPAIQRAAAKHAPKVIFLATPNNPDGGLAERQQIEALLELPAVLVLDEAYIEFAGEEHSLLREVPQRENLVVLRTFSKWAGLAGLRVGYGAFPAAFMPELWKIKQPYNVSYAASTAALASLAHHDQLEEVRAAIVAERGRLHGLLEATPFLQPYPSRANFILCRVDGRSAAALKADLAQRGIFVRYFDKPGVRDCIRVSVGRPEHTDRLAAALLELE